ncbi:GIY-YIG nuclease family protein [Clostridium beijerinckii]|uniref:GIY-YIG domain-containing protein n=1 Tax=Clostridium beijerinckii TaxID=1520 RepID=A0A1S8S781_CLOBE|nr:GIY-YIG nuclease family protein [Clostridium beijerinckii]NRY61506.1 putative GIY-YIG superfamily endonuclease [Clostridium beijerinckii]OOM61293.1 hypothetical protein CLBCK_24270 [Clostridium beijerinckii]
MNYRVKIEEASGLVEDIISNEKYYFEDLVPSKLEEDLAVVYAIVDKNTLETLYVGRTKKLRRRLYTNHLQGNKSTARLKKYIVEDEINYPNINTYDDAKQWIKNNCYFQYINIEDSRERGHVEGLLGFLLDSRYIEDEH